MGDDIDAIDWRSGCPISGALDVLGDRWSLLIIRDLMILGPRTFSDLRDSPEGIATNILSSRLKLLLSLGLIERTDPNASARNNAFRLTDRGAGLRSTLHEVGTWAQTHLADLHPDIHLTPIDL